MFVARAWRATWPGAIGLRHAAGDDHAPISPAPDARRSFRTNRLGKITRIGHFNFFNTLLLTGAPSIPLGDFLFCFYIAMIVTAMDMFLQSTFDKGKFVNSTVLFFVLCDYCD